LASLLKNREMMEQGRNANWLLLRGGS